MQHLLRDVGPEGLDAGDGLSPVQEVHGHAVEQARAPGAGRQAHMQLVQVVFAASCPRTALNLARLRQP